MRNHEGTLLMYPSYYRNLAEIHVGYRLVCVCVYLCKGMRVESYTVHMRRSEDNLNGQSPVAYYLLSQGLSLAWVFATQLRGAGPQAL